MTQQPAQQSGEAGDIVRRRVVSMRFETVKLWEFDARLAIESGRPRLWSLPSEAAL